MKPKFVLLGVLIVAICAAIPPLMASTEEGGEKREFHIKARQYAYDPPRITVNSGDEIHIRLTSLDVIHGFYLEGHDINAMVEPGKKTFQLCRPSEGKEFKEVEEMVFTAGRPGKYRFRCSHTCGTLHPFMQGEFIVNPNYPFLAATGGSVGVLIAMLVFLGLAGDGKQTTEPLEEKLDEA